MTDGASQPRYAALAEELRAEIAAGRLQPGAALPSEPELAQRAGISRTSVRNAVKLLQSWGLVSVERGRGTFVRPRRQVVRRHATERYRAEKALVQRPEYERRVNGPVEQDTELSLDRMTFRAEFDQVPAPADIARVFGVSDGTPMLHRQYFQTPISEGFPLRIGDSWLIYADAERNPDLLEPEKEPWPGGTQHQLWTIGIELSRITDAITARPPTPDEAKALGINHGISVLVLRKVSIDTTGRVVEVADVIMPGDRTELLYTINLPEWEK